MGCLDSLEAEDDYKAPVSEERSFNAKTDFETPTVAHSVASFETTGEAEDALQRLADALEGCTEVDEVDAEGARTQLTGCQAQDSFGDGFVVRGAESSSLVGCQADSNAAAGFRLDGARSVVVSGLTSFRRGERPAAGPGVVLEGGTGRCLLTGVVTGFAVAVEGENPDGITQVVT